MKIAVLSHVTLPGGSGQFDGAEVTISGGGAIHASGLKPYLECDGCLLLGDEPDLLEIAHHMEASGKKIWRHLTEIPSA